MTLFSGDLEAIPCECVIACEGKCPNTSTSRTNMCNDCSSGKHINVQPEPKKPVNAQTVH